jgi:hypothetical protein
MKVASARRSGGGGARRAGRRASDMSSATGSSGRASRSKPAQKLGSPSPVSRTTSPASSFDATLRATRACRGSGRCACAGDARVQRSRPGASGLVDELASSRGLGGAGRRSDRLVRGRVEAGSLRGRELAALGGRGAGPRAGARRGVGVLQGLAAARVGLLDAQLLASGWRVGGEQVDLLLGERRDGVAGRGPIASSSSACRRAWSGRLGVGLRGLRRAVGDGRRLGRGLGAGLRCGGRAAREHEQQAGEDAGWHGADANRSGGRGGGLSGTAGLDGGRRRVRRVRRSSSQLTSDSRLK